MPRPRKCRKVCQIPRFKEFGPLGNINYESPIILSVDEYEAIRLIDKENFSQEECGRFMEISRTTVQLIYDTARKKIAESIVSGNILKIEGGNFRTCSGEEENCGCGGCGKHKNNKRIIKSKEEGKMRIAIPIDENKKDVCIVLARAPYFLFEDEGTQTIVENPATEAQGGAGIEAAQFLVDNKIDVLITVRCGQNAKDVFEASKMKIMKSQGKTVSENLDKFKKEELEALTYFHDGFHGSK